MNKKSAVSIRDEIWNLIKETQQNLKEVAASQKETKQEMKELRASQKETGRQLKEARELFTTQWGRLMESLVEGDLIRVLNDKNIEVKETLMNIKRKKGPVQYEYDIVVKNGSEVVVVEVKTTLRVKYVNLFLEELKKFIGRFPEYRGKKIYGAVAYLRAEEESERYSEAQGLFAIRATGSSSSIVNQEDFKPRDFS